MLVALAATAVELPDPRAGEIDGRVAVMFWPHSAGPAKEPLPVTGCQVHLVPSTNLDAELIFPCGEWLQPPPDKYRVWMEFSGLMSPSPIVLFYSGGPFRTQGMLGVAPVVPAGRIVVPSAQIFGKDKQFRLIHVDSHRFEGGSGNLFDRRVSAAQAHAGVQMPAGDVIAGLFSTNGDALAITRPVRLKHGEPTRAWPVPPARGTDVLAILQRTSTTLEGDIKPELRIGETSKPADVVIDGADRVIGIWYGIDSRTATLSVSSPSSFIEEQHLELRPGTVTTYRGSLKRLPDLNLSVTSPIELGDAIVAEVHTTTLVREVTLATNATSVAELLPAAPLRVVLRVGKWRFTKRVDLSDGLSKDLRFELEPLEVEGVVYSGRSTVPDADVSFSISGSAEVSARTDDAGRYGIVLWQPGYYPVIITRNDPGVPPYLEPFVSVQESGTLDFHLPNNRWRVRAIDRDSGEPVGGVSVLVDSASQGSTGVAHTQQAATTGNDGIALLPPLRKGSVTLTARSDGFRPTGPVTRPVEDDGGSEEIEFRLERESEDIGLRIRLQTGEPAAGTEAWLITPGAASPFWTGISDAHGLLRLPVVEVPAQILLRHRDGGSVAQSYRSGIGELSLPQAAPPLHVTVQQLDGEPARNAPLALTLGGIRLVGPPVGFVTWGSALADREGMWTATNLPGQPITLLAWGRSTSAAAQGNFDSQATTIPWPWPGRAIVRVLQ